jgi:hypothetical protein
MHALLSLKHLCSLDGAYSASRWSNATIHDSIWSIATSFSWWLGACTWRSSSLDLVGFFFYFLSFFSLLTSNFMTTLAKIKCLVNLCLYQFWFLFFLLPFVLLLKFTFFQFHSSTFYFFLFLYSIYSLFFYCYFFFYPFLDLFFQFHQSEFYFI